MTEVSQTTSIKAFKRAFTGGEPARLSSRQLLEGSTRNLGSMPLGQAFIEALAATSATEEILTRTARNAPEQSVGEFVAFENGRFKNAIAYRREDICSPGDLNSVRIHEGAHAMSYIHSAAGYAVPENERTNIFLSPRDSVIFSSLLEIIARAKQIEYDWVRTVRRQDSAETLAQMNHVLEQQGMKTPVQNFAEFYVFYAMSIFFNEYNDKGVVTADAYHKDVLDIYPRGLERFSATRPGAPGSEHFVRMTIQDAIEIGHTFGVNVFETCPALTQRILDGEGISAATLNRIDRLNDYLGIEDERALPTLDQAIRADGLTRAQFIAIGRGEMQWPENTRDRVFGYACEPTR